MKSMNQKAQGGFTLIELMIVVAIIGILAAVAIPQYSNYSTKAKLGNAVTAADSLKSSVALCIQEAGGTTTDCDTGANGIPTFAATKEVASAAVTDGTIVLTLATGIHTDVDSRTITFAPAVTATAVGWTVTTNIANTTFASALTKNSAPAAQQAQQQAQQ
ncbi:pilin [Massilia sp. METH4]|uniref:pilin n=2 Tax=Massilia sp. METH4 TaxID=3123041 RepID=UPI0030CE07A9